MMESGSDTHKEGSDDENPKEDTHTVEERESIRQEISTMSFEDLQKLKEKIGAKMYNETVLGVNRRQKANFKRANKNRPREMSAKRPVNIKQEIVQIKKKIQTPRDPRFDPLCGTFDEIAFKSNYKFLYNMRKEEYMQLEKEYQKSEDQGEQKKIKYVMQRLGNQVREHEKHEREKLKMREEKQDIREKLRKGEKPVFKKKSEKKLESLIEKYEELKKTNKLQKHIEKRSRKLESKSKRQFNKTNF